MCEEVLHPVEYVVHGAGVLVAGVSISNGIPADRVILVVEGEGHKGGLLELGQGCVGCSKATGVDEQLNACQSEGYQKHVFAYLAIINRSTEEEEPKVDKVCDVPLVCIPIVEVQPTLIYKCNWYWEDAV